MFYEEVNEAYGYCSDVKALYLRGSIPVHICDQNNSETSDSICCDDISNNSCKSSSLQAKSIACGPPPEAMEQRERKIATASEDLD